MAYILNIETATTVCSVALFNDNQLLCHREVNNGYTHAENLHVFISEVLKEASVAFADLKAVAVSKGPGSYTGLRIGTSAAKGLAYALSIPLIAIDTLVLLASIAKLEGGQHNYYCPMLDARRMEVYTALYKSSLEPVQEVSARIITEDTLTDYEQLSGICFFGDGMPKCRELLQKLNGPVFINDIVPSARFMGALAFKKLMNKEFESTAYFEPFYLKDFLAGKKKANS